MKVLDNSHESHDCAPGEHHGANPDGGSDDFENHVAGDLKKSIGKKEDGQAGGLLAKRF
jgi:hypothetical protein